MLVVEPLSPFGRVAEQALRSSERMSTNLMRGMGGGGGFGSALRMGTGIGAGMFVFDKLKDSVMSIPTAFWSAINDASEAESIDRKFQNVFDNLTPRARKFAQSLSQDLGRSETELKNFMNRFQDTLVPDGVQSRQVIEANSDADETIGGLGCIRSILRTRDSRPDR